MKPLRWICAGVLVGLTGVVAFAIATTPSDRTAGTPTSPEATSVVATVPVAPVVATAPAPAPAPARHPGPVAVTPAPAAPTSGIVPGSAGMVIGIDPETGEIGMPTPEQLAELNLSEDEAASHDDAGLVPVYSPDGTVTGHLQGRYQEFGVIRKTADGTIVTGCVDHPSKAAHVHPAPAAIEEE